MTRAAEKSFPWALLCAAAVAAPLLLLLLQYGAGRDQGVYLLTARAMEAGGIPYRDVWDVKPPGIFLVYRAALAFGGGMLPVRALEALALVSQALAFAVLTRRFMGSAVPGAWAGALAVLIHARLEFWHTGQPESFGGPVLAWALVLATNPTRKTFSRAAAGALFGFAAFLKPPLGGGVVLVPAILAWRDARATTTGRARAVLEPFAAMAFGALAVGAAILMWLALGGAFPDFLETFRDFVPRYTALGLHPESLPGLAWRALFEWFVGYSALIPAGVALLLLCPGSEEENWGLALVGAVLVPQIAGVAMQAKFFAYHYGAALPFGALIAAWGAARAWRRFPGRTARFVGVLLAVVLLRSESSPHIPWLGRAVSRVRAAFSAADRDRILDEIQSTGDVDAAANRMAVAWLRRETPPDSPVFVWGYRTRDLRGFGTRAGVPIRVRRAPARALVRAGREAASHVRPRPPRTRRHRRRARRRDPERDGGFPGQRRRSRALRRAPGAARIRLRGTAWDDPLQVLSETPTLPRRRTAGRKLIGPAFPPGPNFDLSAAGCASCGRSRRRRGSPVEVRGLVALCGGRPGRREEHEGEKRRGRFS